MKHPKTIVKKILKENPDIFIGILSEPILFSENIVINVKLYKDGNYRVTSPKMIIDPEFEEIFNREMKKEMK